MVVVILEQFGICPVESGAAEQTFGYPHRTAQSLQQKDRFRILGADFCDNIFPGFIRQHITGVAAEAVNALAAPVQEHFRHQRMHFRLPVLQFAEVGPGHAPGAGGDKGAVLFPDKPFRMIYLNFRRPAGMIDRNINKNPGIAGVDSINQLHELLHRRGFDVKFGIRRIDVEKIQRRERTAETSHPGISCRFGVDGQQLDDPASQLLSNKIKIADHLPESAGRRNHGVTFFVKQADRFGFFLAHCPPGQIGAELPHEQRVHGIGADFGRGFHFYFGVFPLDPDRPPGAVFQKPCLGFETADFDQRQRDFEQRIADARHCQIMPVPGQYRLLFFGMRNDFLAAHRRAADIGTQKSVALSRTVQFETELQAVAALLQ